VYIPKIRKKFGSLFKALAAAGLLLVYMQCIPEQGKLKGKHVKKSTQIKPTQMHKAKA
jgi:hypothetical protein